MTATTSPQTDPLTLHCRSSNTLLSTRATHHSLLMAATRCPGGVCLPVGSPQPSHCTSGICGFRHTAHPHGEQSDSCEDFELKDFSQARAEHHPAESGRLQTRCLGALNEAFTPTHSGPQSMSRSVPTDLRLSPSSVSTQLTSCPSLSLGTPESEPLRRHTGY